MLDVGIVGTAAGVALQLGQLAWPVLDSKLFDGAISSAKTAAVNYLSGKATELALGAVSGLMGKGKKKKAKAIMAIVDRAGTSSKPLKRIPLKQQAAQKSGVRRAMGMSRASSRGGFSMKSYSVPIARGRTMQNRGPRIGGRKAATIEHSEYLGEIAGSVGFANTPYAINPGLVQSFPWLAAIATQYEQYKFRKLTYRYETEAASTKAGAVVLVTDYDALDAPFVAKDQAMQYKGATRTVTWTRVAHRCDRQEASPYSLRYVRSSAVPSGGDQKTYDVGNFQLITQGQSDTTTVGELYVDYVIDLIGPKTNNILGANLLCADIRSGGTFNQANPLGSAPAQIEGTTIQVTSNGVSVTINQTGRFLFYYYWTGTVATATSLAAAGGASQVTDYGFGVNAAATAGWACKSFDLELNQGQGITITIAGTTYTGAILVISQISGALAAPKPKPQRGMPIMKLEDPLSLRVQQLEAMVRKLGLGCAMCGGVGDHAIDCVVLRPRALPPSTNGGL